MTGTLADLLASTAHALALAREEETRAFRANDYGSLHAWYEATERRERLETVMRATIRRVRRERRRERTTA